VKRGPSPTPTAIRRLKGNPGKRAFNASEPVVPVVGLDSDEPPPLIAGDASAAAEWRRLAPLLRRARVLTEADVNALTAYCQQWSIYQHALTQAPPERRVVRSPHDYPVVNPYLTVANKALMFCDRIGEQLGLSPGGRARVAASPEAEDAFKAFDTPHAPRLPRARKDAENGTETTH